MLVQARRVRDELFSSIFSYFANWLKHPKLQTGLNCWRTPLIRWNYQKSSLLSLKVSPSKSSGELVYWKLHSMDQHSMPWRTWLSSARGKIFTSSKGSITQLNPGRLSSEYWPQKLYKSVGCTVRQGLKKLDWQLNLHTKWGREEKGCTNIIILYKNKTTQRQ
jgi:hypothetical protein